MLETQAHTPLAVKPETLPIRRTDEAQRNHRRLRTHDVQVQRAGAEGHGGALDDGLPANDAIVEARLAHGQPAVFSAHAWASTARRTGRRPRFST